MSTIQFKNHYPAELEEDLGASDTQIVLKSGHGANFPVVASAEEKHFFVTLVNAAGAKEIIKIIQRASGSDTLVVGDSVADQPSGSTDGRAQEGTSALAVVAADDHVIELRLTAGIMQDMIDRLEEAEADIVVLETADAAGKIAAALPGDEAAMQATSDPYPEETPDLATTLAEMVNQLKHALAGISGEDYWYVPPSVRTLKSSVVSTIWVPATAMIPLDTAGASAQLVETTTHDNMRLAYAFDGATKQYAAFEVAMPEGWDRGTIKAKFYWGAESGSSAGDTVEWEIAATALGDSDALDVAQGAAQVVSDTLLANDGGDMQVTAATPAVTVGGTPALGDVLNFKVARNVTGTDDMTEDALLYGVLLQFTESFPDAAAGVAVAAW